jgi:glutaredoxin-like protein NrdH
MTHTAPNGEAVASPDQEVIVYTKPNCVQCNATYRSLDKAGIPYKIVDLTQDAEAMKKVQDLGYRQAPVVIAGSEHWSGFNPAQIRKLEQIYAEKGDDTPEFAM